MNKLMYFSLCAIFYADCCFAMPPKVRRGSAIQAKDSINCFIDSANIHDAFLKHQDQSYSKILKNDGTRKVGNADFIACINIFPYNELHVFAFNVGQANFILLRKENKGVIIDAGGSFHNDTEIQAFKEFIFNAIEITAVFITHPHDDHYNMISSLKSSYGNAFQNTKYFLGGKEDAWTEINEKGNPIKSMIEFKSIIIEKEKTFLSYEELIRNDLLDGVEFNVFQMLEAKNPNTEANINSPFIRVKYANKSILFTGDSYGESIDRIKGEVNDFSQFSEMPNADVDLIDSVYEGINTIVDDYSKSAAKFKYDNSLHGEILRDYETLFNRFYIQQTKDAKLRMFFKNKLRKKLDDNIRTALNRIFKSLGLCAVSGNKRADFIKNLAIASIKLLDHPLLVDDFCQAVKDTTIKGELMQAIAYQPIAAQELFEKSINAMIKRRIFEESQLVFLPHHGTNTENSQRILGYFGGLEEDDNNRVFVISSSPFGKDHVPKRSTLEMAPCHPKQKEHLFVYQQDNNYLKDACYFKRITKPVYVTGAAPGGCYCFKITHDDESLSLLDCEDGWIPVLSPL